jgi:hypothetical protein
LEIAKLTYQPKFYINEKVIYMDKEYYIRGLRATACSHPEFDVEYELSENYNHASTSNTSSHSGVNERELMSINDYRIQKIEEAKIFLIENGITNLIK